MRNLPNKKGFTLIELIIVIVVLGVLATIALPKFVDFSQTAKINATKSSLGSVRSVLAIKYAQSATAGGAPSYPATVTGTDFADGQTPKNEVSGNRGVTALAATAGGTATNANGFWYVTATASADYGRAGAYSDGTINTSDF